MAKIYEVIPAVQEDSLDPTLHWGYAPRREDAGDILEKLEVRTMRQIIDTAIGDR